MFIFHHRSETQTLSHLTPTSTTPMTSILPYPPPINTHCKYTITLYYSQRLLPHYTKTPSNPSIHRSPGSQTCSSLTHLDTSHPYIRPPKFLNSWPTPGYCQSTGQLNNFNIGNWCFIVQDLISIKYWISILFVTEILSLFLYCNMPDMFFLNIYLTDWLLTGVDRLSYRQPTLVISVP